MKKLSGFLLGLSLVFGTVSLASAQERSESRACTADGSCRLPRIRQTRQVRSSPRSLRKRFREGHGQRQIADDLSGP